MMDFLTELHEARMTRDSGNQRVLSYTDCCERLYLTMLVLELLRRYPQFAPVAHGYAKRTTDRDSYKHFRMYATDLYNFAYFVQGDEEALNKLKDPKAAMAIRRRTTLPAMAFNRYLMAMSTGRVTSLNDQTVFLGIESALNIVNTDYKAIRRSLFNFNRLSTGDKKKIVTRLLYACRAKLRSSDIIEHLEALAAVRDLESAKVRDPEPTVSIPDVSVDIKDLGKSMKTGGRYHHTKEGGSYHTDGSHLYKNPPDYVGLLCINPAKKGGVSKFMSAYTIHNKLLDQKD